MSGAENETTRIGLAELQNDVSGKLIVTPADAVLGQFFYAIAHEVGQAMFDLLNVPGFWHQEAAAARRGRFLASRYFKWVEAMGQRRRSWHHRRSLNRWRLSHYACE